MIKNIISTENKIYKEAKKLDSRSHRTKTGLFIAEGERLVNDAILCGVAKYIIIDENYDNINLITLPIYRFSNKLFNEISGTETTQGIVAVCKMMENKRLANVTGDMLVICDGVSDPGNLGTIIRTAECSGASGVIMLTGCVDVYNPKTVRSTMGSIFRIPLYFAQPEELAMLNSYEIVVAMLDGASDLYQTEFKQNVALVIGSEAHGVSNLVAGFATKKTKIPMCGGAESLNAAVAGGIIMYEIFRRKERR